MGSFAFRAGRLAGHWCRRRFSGGSRGTSRLARQRLIETRRGRGDSLIAHRLRIRRDDDDWVRVLGSPELLEHLRELFGIATAERNRADVAFLWVALQSVGVHLRDQQLDLIDLVLRSTNDQAVAGRMRRDAGSRIFLSGIDGVQGGDSGERVDAAGWDDSHGNSAADSFAVELLDHAFDLLVLSRRREDVDTSRAAVFIHDTAGIENVQRLRHFLRIGGLDRVDVQVRLAAARATNGTGQLFDVDCLEQLFDDFVLGRVGRDQQAIGPLIRADLHLGLGSRRRGYLDRTTISVTHLAAATTAKAALPRAFGDRFDPALQTEHRTDFVFGIERVDVLQLVSLEADVGRSRAQRDQQVVNTLQILADVCDADRARTFQCDDFALWTDQFLRFFGGLFSRDVLDPQDDVHQFVASAFGQVRHLHIGDEIGRNRIVDVHDDQELIATDQDISLLQQVAVDDVERGFGRVFLLVEIVECPRRHDIEIERQASELRERLEHIGPSRMSEVERDFFRLRRFGLHWFRFRSVRVRWLLFGDNCRGLRGGEFIGRFSERHNRLARLVVGLARDRFTIDCRLRTTWRLRFGRRRAGRFCFGLCRVSFSGRFRSFERRPLLTLSVGQNREPLLVSFFAKLVELRTHVFAASATESLHQLAGLLAGFFGDRFELCDLLIGQLQICRDVAAGERAGTTLLESHLPIPSELLGRDELLDVRVGLKTLLFGNLGRLGHHGSTFFFRGIRTQLGKEITAARILAQLVADLTNLGLLVIGQLEFFGIGIAEQQAHRRTTKTAATAKATSSAARTLGHGNGHRRQNDERRQHKRQAIREIFHGEVL